MDSLYAFTSFLKSSLGNGSSKEGGCKSRSNFAYRRRV